MDLCSEPRLPLRPSWQCQVTFAAALITSKSGREATRFLSLFSKAALFPSRRSRHRRGGGLRPMFGRAVPADTCHRAGLHPAALAAALGRIDFESGSDSKSSWADSKASFPSYHKSRRTTARFVYSVHLRLLQHTSKAAFVPRQSPFHSGRGFLYSSSE